MNIGFSEIISESEYLLIGVHGDDAYNLDTKIAHRKLLIGI